MDDKEKFDFWYAVNNTEVLIRPKKALESFGTTSIDYHLVTEVMDAIDVVKVREGRLHAYKPEIITPQDFQDSILEGFLENQAEDYVQWLREHQQSLVILRYGFKIRKEEFRVETIHDRLDAVVDRVQGDLAAKDQPLCALIRGVDEPWEVCLIRLMVEMVQHSVVTNARDLKDDPQGHHREIDHAFREAARDPGKIQALAQMLQTKELFHEYEDRFFSLVRSTKG